MVSSVLVSFIEVSSDLILVKFNGVLVVNMVLEQGVQDVVQMVKGGLVKSVDFCQVNFGDVFVGLILDFLIKVVDGKVFEVQLQQIVELVVVSVVFESLLESKVEFCGEFFVVKFNGLIQVMV